MYDEVMEVDFNQLVIRFLLLEEDCEYMNS